MERNLEQAISRFEAATSTEITYHGLDWPEYEQFLAALSSLTQLSRALIPSPSINETIRDLWRASQVLRSAPIRANHDEVGLTLLLDKEWPVAGPEFMSALDKCRRISEALVAAPDHPAMRITKLQISEVRATDAECLIHAVVARHCLRAMGLVNEEQGLGLNVVDITRAKWSDIGTLCLLFGAPYLLNNNTRFGEPDSESRIVSWLFHAPIAPRVSVLSWTGNPAFNPAKYVGFPGQTLELSNPRGPLSFHFEWQDIQVAEVPPSPPPIGMGTVDGEGEPVESSAVLLADNLWVHYADHVGPRPERLVADDFEISLESVKSISHLRPGDIVAVSEDDASREFIDNESRRLLEERYGKDQPILSYTARDRFQAAIRELELQPDGVRRLRQVGLEDWKIAYRFRLSHDRSHIAPDDRNEYESIARACGLMVDENDWDHIRRLRASRKLAGRNARALIDKSIREDDSWMDQIDVPRAVRVSLEGLGAVILSRILAIAPDSVLVPVSRLGSIIRSSR